MAEDDGSAREQEATTRTVTAAVAELRRAGGGRRRLALRVRRAPRQQLGRRLRRRHVGGTASPIGRITVPWDDLEHTGPEVACIAADPIVASAVLQTFVPAQHLGPNPDLSLRFTTAPATPVVLTSGTALTAPHGTATAAVEVHAGDQQLAHGMGAAPLLPAGPSSE